jgi:ABC-type glycerol-3-phosphate transport system substrate-binding protein
MQTKTHLALGVVAVLAAACGSSSSSGSGGGSGTSYAFVPPASGVTRIFAETIVDNAGNTIDIGFSDTGTRRSTQTATYTALVQSTTGDSTISQRHQLRRHDGERKLHR